MEKRVGQLLQSAKLGDKIEYKNMIIFPIISDEKNDYKFLTIDEALDNEYVEVQEMSDMGDVPNLRLKNLSRQKIFILDGEELIGAKQNRVTNSVVLAPELEELVIPVSCVERNRWNYKTKRFSSGHTRVYFRLRKKIFESEINNKYNTLKQHPQHDVWNDIEMKMSNMHVDSTTSAMNDIYRKNIEKLEKYNKMFNVSENQIGMVVIINNRILSCELFSDHKILAKLHSKIINSYAIDALEDYDGKLKDLKTIRRRALKFLNNIKKSTYDESFSVGLGKDIMFNSDDVCGSSLCFDDKVVYMSAYSKTH